jgi:hypothetical protein
MRSHLNCHFLSLSVDQKMCKSHLFNGTLLFSVGVAIVVVGVLYRNPYAMPTLSSGSYPGYFTATQSLTSNCPNNATGWDGQLALSFAADLYCFIPVNMSGCDLTTLVNQMNQQLDPQTMSITIDDSTCNMDYWWRPMTALGLQSLIGFCIIGAIMIALGVYMCICRGKNETPRLHDPPISSDVAPIDSENERLSAAVYPTTSAAAIYYPMDSKRL